MKKLFIYYLLGIIVSSIAVAQERKEESNLRQYYSGKFGFYQPGDGLNNGLLFGIDGVTEFIHYHFILTGAIDLYPKQTISIFKDPKPDVQQQSMILLPLHVNDGYQFFNAPLADSRGFIGAGIGYYFYFYSVEYRSTGGIIPSPTTQTESKSGGSFFATAFVRFLLGKIFVEPRLYLATKKEDSVSGGYNYVVNPTGFSISLGFQY